MKLKRSLFGLGVLAVTTSSLLAEAPSVGADLTVNSKYMFRGLDLSGRSVFQPDAWVGWGDLSIATWMNIDLTDSLEQRGDVNEVDISIDYAHEFENVALGLGYVMFSYPVATEDTQGSEAYLSVGSNWDVFNISAQINYDLGNRCVYFAPELSVGYTFADFITPSLSTTLGISGENYGKFYYDTDLGKGFLNDWTSCLNLEVDLPGNVGEHLYFSGSVNYSLLLNDDIVKVVEADDWGGQKGNFWAGITASVGF